MRRRVQARNICSDFSEVEKHGATGLEDKTLAAACYGEIDRLLASVGREKQAKSRHLQALLAFAITHL